MKTIKRGVILLSLLASSVLAIAQTEIIDNKKLVELTNAKLGDELIIGFIQSSPTNFDCSINAILKLRKENVSNGVLAEVMKVCNSSKIAKADSANSNNPLYVHQSGIYIYEKKDTAGVLKKLYSTVATQEKSGGLGDKLGSIFSYGTSKTSTKVSVNGPVANVKCKIQSEFYFYFDATSKGLSKGDWWFSEATSPNEFTLLKLTKKTRTREFEKGKSDSYTYQSGINEDQKVQFSFEEIKPGIFKVVTKELLKPGEYCFIYSSTVPRDLSNDKIFDFSVEKEN